ncbi:GGDEF domain-containing protein [Paenibacillus alvei]|uniref:GGDEF domain-containing protein n=1 Tax=Paenibacillus alvei TaxID=44250 RepID=UPI0039907CB8
MDLVHAASYQSVTDGLTGLYYKSYFIRKVQESMNSGSGSSIIFVDIDNFKKLNDTQGHLVGDQILRLSSAILKKCVGEYGITGRYGGEELVALITNTRVSPSQIAEAFREQVQELSQDIHPVTVSVGFSIFDHETERAEDYIKQADDALYMAKRLGKNRVVQFSQEWSEGDTSVPQTSSNEEDRVDVSDVSDENNVPMQSETEAGHVIMVHQEPNEAHLSIFETDEPVPTNKHRLSSVDYLTDQESEGVNNEEQSLQEVIIQQMKVKNPFPRSRP